MRRLRIRTLLVVIAVLTVCIGLGYRHWRQSALRRQSFVPMQMDLLATIHVAQAAFQAAAYVDQDGDGVGEFGTLSELAGLDGRRTLTGRPTGVALIPPALGLDAYRRGGTGQWQDLCFRVDLPSGRGAALSAPGGAPTPAAIDGQETFWVAYGWAATASLPIPTAVAIVPDAMYRIRCPMEDRTHHYVGLGDAPRPGAIMGTRPPRPPSGQSLEAAREWWSDPQSQRVPVTDDLEGEIAPHGEPGGDGERWLIGSDGFVGMYGHALAGGAWAKELAAILGAGLPPAGAQTAAPPPARQPRAAAEAAATPPATGAQTRWLALPLQSRFILVVDASSSMEWGQVEPALRPPDLPSATPWHALVRQLLHVIAGTTTDQQMGLVMLGKEPTAWRNELVPCTRQNVEAAAAWLAARELDAYATVHEGVARACELGAGGEPTQFVLITDGVPTSGVNCVPLMRMANTCGARIDVVLYGSMATSGYIDPIAGETGGVVIRFP